MIIPHSYFATIADRLLLVNIFQLLWDRIDPSGWLSHIADDPLPDTPVKTLCMAYGLGGWGANRGCLGDPIHISATSQIQTTL